MTETPGRPSQCTSVPRGFHSGPTHIATHSPQALSPENMLGLFVLILNAVGSFTVGSLLTIAISTILMEF